MPRTPQNGKALTTAERQRRYKARLKARAEASLSEVSTDELRAELARRAVPQQTTVLYEALAAFAEEIADELEGETPEDAAAAWTHEALYALCAHDVVVALPGLGKVREIKQKRGAMRYEWRWYEHPAEGDGPRARLSRWVHAELGRADAARIRTKSPERN